MCTCNTYTWKCTRVCNNFACNRSFVLAAHQSHLRLSGKNLHQLNSQLNSSQAVDVFVKLGGLVKLDGQFSERSSAKIIMSLVIFITNNCAQLQIHALYDVHLHVSLRKPNQINVHTYTWSCMFEAVCECFHLRTYNTHHACKGDYLRALRMETRKNKLYVFVVVWYFIILSQHVATVYNRFVRLTVVCNT